MATKAYLSWNCCLLLLGISIWEILYDYNNQQPHWDFSYFNKHLIKKLFNRFLQSSLHPWSPTDFVRNWLLVSIFIFQNNLWWIFFRTVHLNVTRTSFKTITIKQFLLLSGFLFCFSYIYDFRKIFNVL